MVGGLRIRRSLAVGSDPNHFQFRILSDRLFEIFAFIVAVRTRNVLAPYFIQSWIDVIVSTDGPEVAVVRELASMLGIPRGRCWVVGRESIRDRPPQELRILRLDDDDDASRSTSEDAPNELALVSREDMEELPRPNVVVIDQAAHHFVTFEGLDRAIASTGGRSFALSVLVDRFSPHESEVIPLPTTRYLPLFRWPAMAWTTSSCACSVPRKGAQ